MRGLADNGLKWRALRAVLVTLTLISSAVHFADNAFRLDLYPGPAWLTRNVVLGAWLIVLAAAWLAYRSGKRWTLVAYAALGFAGLAHYLGPHKMGIPLRCTVTVSAEAITSVMLILFAVFQPLPRRSRQL